MAALFTTLLCVTNPHVRDVIYECPVEPSKTWHQTSANRGPDLRFVLEAIIKAVIYANLAILATA